MTDTPPQGSNANDPVAQIMTYFEQTLEARITEVEQGFNAMFRQLYHNQQALEQAILMKEYPNDFAIRADDAWKRFIASEYQRLEEQEQDGVRLRLIEDDVDEPFDLEYGEDGDDEAGD